MDELIEGMFAGTSITKVSLPGTIKIIKADTFFACQSLKEVFLEKGVEEIKADAFINCPALEKLILPKSIKYIAEKMGRSQTAIAMRLDFLEGKR